MEDSGRGRRVSVTYESERIAEQYESRRMVRQLVGQTLHIGVHLIIRLGNFQCLLINLIYIVPESQLISPRFLLHM